MKNTFYLTWTAYPDKQDKVDLLYVDQHQYSLYWFSYSAKYKAINFQGITLKEFFIMCNMSLAMIFIFESVYYKCFNCFSLLKGMVAIT